MSVMLLFKRQLLNHSFERAVLGFKGSLHTSSLARSLHSTSIRERTSTQPVANSNVPKIVEYLKSYKFNHSMTKVLLFTYSIFLVFGLNYMYKLHGKELQVRELTKLPPESLTELQTLELKELNNELTINDKIVLYRLRNGLPLSPDPNTQLSAKNTTDFYDTKSSSYDKDINMEEWIIGLKRRRKWLMNQLEGNVLEIATGTGRNINLLKRDTLFSKIKSYTFLDSSFDMLSIAKEKFEKKFPNYKYATFVNLPAENLVNEDNFNNGTLSQNEGKYDTIIDTFGMCAFEDPSKVINNLSYLLKDDGKIILLEHGRSLNHNWINKILDNRAEKRLKEWGCRWNLDIENIIINSNSGLIIDEIKKFDFGTTYMITLSKLQKNDTTSKD